MSFDLKKLTEAVALHETVTRIVVAEVQGSTPRETGAEMLVWFGGQSGTIGGGALELEAAKRALSGTDWLDRVPLGPGLGQCCGGAVTLVAEIWDVARISAISGTVIVRRVTGDAEMPLKIRSAIKMARSSGARIDTQLVSGWLIEPIAAPSRDIWIYGAGHVGRALVSVMAQLPEISITWVDSSDDRFPDDISEGVAKLVAANPADVVKYADASAEHLILTYSHALDLEICDRLLHHGFQRTGLIGSKTKWARFRRRLAEMGHADAQISRINCPIGRPELGKHPQAIAVGVVADILSSARTLKNLQQRVG